MGIRQVGDLRVAAGDVVFEDDDHVLAVDDDADVWRVGLDGARASLGIGAEVHAGLAQVFARNRAAQAQALPRTPTARQIAWHGGSGGLVVHVDHFGMWSLVGRVDAAGWRPVLTGSQILSYPILTWSPDGTHLAVNAEHVAVVDPTGAQPHRALSAEAWGWTPAGQLLLYDWGHETAPGVLHLADPATGQRQVLGEPVDVGAWGSAEAIAVTADGDACMIAYVKGLVWYSLPSLEILHAHRSDADRIDRIAVTADRATVVVDHERGVRLWNLATAEPLTPMLRTITSARPAPSGNRYVCRSSAPPAGQGAPSWSIWELT